MNQNQWIKLVGFIVLLIPVIEIISGVAWEKTGLVRRCEKPGLYWFSIICKIIVGLAIINIQYLRARFGN